MFSIERDLTMLYLQTIESVGFTILTTAPTHTSSSPTGPANASAKYGVKGISLLATNPAD